MVTFMDISLFAYIGPVFMFLFVFAIVYGLLVVSKLFKDVPGANGIYGIIAFVAGLFVLISKDTFMIIGSMTPWFTVLIIFVFLIFLVVKMFAGADTDIFENMVKQGPVRWVLVVVFVLILIISLSSSFGQHMLEQGTGTTPQNTGITPTGSSMSAGTTNGQVQTSGQVVVVDQNGNVVPSSPSSGLSSSSQDTSSVASSDFSSNVLATFINPKILGLILMMIIGFFSILLLTQAND